MPIRSRNNFSSLIFILFLHHHLHGTASFEKKKTLVFQVGDTIDLDCSSSGETGGIWTLNDNLLFDLSDENNIVLDNGTLHILSATPEHSGSYACYQGSDDIPWAVYQVVVKAATTEIDDDDDDDNAREENEHQPIMAPSEHDDSSAERENEQKPVKIENEQRPAEMKNEQKSIENENVSDGEKLSSERKVMLPDSEEGGGHVLQPGLFDHQFSRRLVAIESTATLMQAEVDARLQRMEQQMTSLLRSLHEQQQQQQQDRPSAGRTNGGPVLSWTPTNPLKSEEVAEQRLVEGQYVNDYTWIIPHVESLFEESSSSGNGSHFLQSPAFYTHRPGYRMRLLFYPHYKSNNASGLFAGLVTGEYDRLLPWPFPHDYQLTVVSHQPNVVDDAATIRLSATNCSPGVFERPRSTNPPACGFREFISHAKLNKHKRAFLIYGNLVVRIRIFAGV